MKSQKAEKYFSDQEIFGNTPSKKGKKNKIEKIKLDFSIENSDTGTYSIKAKLYEGQAYDFFSEQKESFIKQTINFQNYLICDFKFEKQQNIDIFLIKNNAVITYHTTLGCIVGSRNSTVVYKYAGNESLLIKAEKLGNYEDLLDVKLKIKVNNINNNNNSFSENQYFYVVSSNNKLVYKSSLNKKDGTFEPIYIPTCILQPDYTISLHNLYKQKIYSFNRATKDVQLKQKIGLETKIDKNRNLSLIDSSKIIKNYSFIDYIKSGVQIALSIGIDFTSSNGIPSSKESSHSIIGDPKYQRNDYERAIEKCGNIVGKYDYDQLFPVFGFGAVINTSQNRQPSMCFNLNMTNDPNIKGIDNVLKVYRDCLRKNIISFSEPTKFEPLLRKVISRIDKNNPFEYHILMILTDGVIEDLQKTIDVLVEASNLPLSVIIIGIGKENFKKMEILDGDIFPLTSSTGKIRTRDIVQFVPFAKYQNNEEQLAMEVLAEIPRQIVEYYRNNDSAHIQIEKKLKLIKQKSQNIESSQNAPNSKFDDNKDNISNTYNQDSNTTNMKNTGQKNQMSNSRNRNQNNLNLNRALTMNQNRGNNNNNNSNLNIQTQNNIKPSYNIPHHHSHNYNLNNQAQNSARINNQNINHQQDNNRINNQNSQSGKGTTKFVINQNFIYEDKAIPNTNQNYNLRSKANPNINQKRKNNINYNQNQNINNNINYNKNPNINSNINYNQNQNINNNFNYNKNPNINYNQNQNINNNFNYNQNQNINNNINYNQNSNININNNYNQNPNINNSNPNNNYNNPGGRINEEQMFIQSGNIYGNSGYTFNRLNINNNIGQNNINSNITSNESNMENPIFKLLQNNNQNNQNFYNNHNYGQMSNTISDNPNNNLSHTGNIINNYNINNIINNINNPSSGGAFQSYNYIDLNNLSTHTTQKLPKKK